MNFNIVYIFITLTRRYSKNKLSLIILQIKHHTLKLFTGCNKTFPQYCISVFRVAIVFSISHCDTF